ncbi:radical SAM family heme chaperone HemW [Salinibius halmophilus]|uniref:radical SAM family heme chaperone HemW n=1 Tax=Salinibius halmophilus TaxID=1853216 RepID=UPI001F3AC083|nr:radical SAM family heme chaperone HemW [Salinibius halmophilus]
MSLPPLSLYLHTPWCVQKCPYCDFNSHEGSIDSQGYLAKLKQDFLQDLPKIEDRTITTIFIGGGTPSLLSAEFYQDWFHFLRQHVDLADDCEITLEANPGTAEAGNFCGYREAGINRLSLGVQSFANEQLNTLGRIHSANEAQQAFAMARAAGFERINIDLMFALPNQTVAQALADLEQAFALNPEHISWYQLTIEPNTAFYRHPPELPDDELSSDIWLAGMDALANHGYQQYEISAYAKAGEASRHNLAYWTFADYLGIGAGAHGKLTMRDGSIWRSQKTRTPSNYLAAMPQTMGKWTQVAQADLPFEIMLNVLRLKSGIQHSPIPLPNWAEDTLNMLRKQGLVHPNRLQLTEHGWPYYNDIVGQFIAD